MARQWSEAGRGRLERSCGGGDWIHPAPPLPGIERIEARFAGAAYAPHRHDTYAIGLTLAGVQRFHYRGARRDSLAGQAIVLHPDERHDGGAGDATALHYRMVYLAPRLIAEALAEEASSLPFVSSPVTADRRLAGAVRAMLRSLDALEADGAVLTLAEALLALDASARKPRRARAICARGVDRARAFLDAHVARAVRSEELEAASGLDRFTLARQFRARFGTSPHRYLTMRRLDRARMLLTAGEPIAATALDSGFADQSHMTRQFLRAYGLTPGRWRALARAAR